MKTDNYPCRINCSGGCPICAPQDHECLLVSLFIACEPDYPFCEALYSDIADFEQKTGRNIYHEAIVTEDIPFLSEVRNNLRDSGIKDPLEQSEEIYRLSHDWKHPYDCKCALHV